MFKSFKKAKVVGQTINVLSPLFNSSPMKVHPPNPPIENNTVIFALILDCSKITLGVEFGIDSDGEPNVEDQEIVQVTTKVIEGLFQAHKQLIADNFASWLYASDMDITDVFMGRRDAEKYMNSLTAFGTEADEDGEFKNPAMMSLHSKISFPDST